MSGKKYSTPHVICLSYNDSSLYSYSYSYSSPHLTSSHLTFTSPHLPSPLIISFYFVYSFVDSLLQLLMLVGRALQTIIFSALANIKRKHKITPKTQFFIFHAGMHQTIFLFYVMLFCCVVLLFFHLFNSFMAGLRGSIAFSLALNTMSSGLPNAENIVACTVVSLSPFSSVSPFSPYFSFCYF